MLLFQFTGTILGYFLLFLTNIFLFFLPLTSTKRCRLTFSFIKFGSCIGLIYGVYLHLRLRYNAPRYNTLGVLNNLSCVCDIQCCLPECEDTDRRTKQYKQINKTDKNILIMICNQIINAFDNYDMQSSHSFTFFLGSWGVKWKFKAYHRKKY